MGAKQFAAGSKTQLKRKGVNKQILLIDEVGRWRAQRAQTGLKRQQK